MSGRKVTSLCTIKHARIVDGICMRPALKCLPFLVFIHSLLISAFVRCILFRRAKQRNAIASIYLIISCVLDFFFVLIDLRLLLSTNHPSPFCAHLFETTTDSRRRPVYSILPCLPHAKPTISLFTVYLITWTTVITKKLGKKLGKTSCCPLRRPTLVDPPDRSSAIQPIHLRSSLQRSANTIHLSTIAGFNSRSVKCH